MGIGSAAAIGGIGSIVGSAIGANGAESAAATQSAADQQASTLAGNAGTQALGIQQAAGTAAQSQLAPYTAAGAGGLNALQYGLGTGGTANGSGVGQGSLLTPYQSFSAPTTLDEQNDPGYQARLALGATTLQNSAAARGSVLTGGTAKALEDYAQTDASNEYGNVYNRALQTYGTNATNYYTGQNNDYTRLSGLANSGQAAAGTAATLGQSAAAGEAGTVTGTAATQGQDLTNAGAATASGYVGAANAYSNGINGATGNLTNLALLNNLRPATNQVSGSPGATGSQTTTFADGTTPYTTSSSYQ